MVTRRNFIKLAGLSACTCLSGEALAGEGAGPSPDVLGMLTDITLCVGCRSCEAACNRINELPEPDRPFEDLSVLETLRRMNEKAYTVVNRYPSARDREKPVHVKFQCMHCNHPACVSACLLGALQKEKEGPVTWTGWKCMGCRYCMVACPFQVPAYEYHKGIGPRVMKCTMCHPLVREGKTPACAAACPMQAITFGPRAKLLEIARERIRKAPERYVDHIYGEHEVGGTSWMYIGPQEFDERMGFLRLSDEAPPELTEGIQHGVFKYFIPPILLYSGLGALMYFSGKRKEHSGAPEGDGTGGPGGESGDDAAVETSGKTRESAE